MIPKALMGDYEVPRTGPGKTTPRLLQDLLDYDPRRPRKDGFNILVDPAPVFKPQFPSQYPQRRLPYECHHKLLRKDNQSIVPQINEQPTPFSRYISASYCEYCQYHFDVIVNYDVSPEKNSPCRFEAGYPLHHLQYIDSQSQDDLNSLREANRYEDYKEIHRWSCSAPQCPAVVQIRIYPPRLSKELIECVTDTSAVFDRGMATINGHPERYQDARPLLPYEILVVLRTYLFDALNQRPNESKRIAVRNKKFLLAFSDECNNLLEYLDFVPHQEESVKEGEGIDSFWILPTVPPADEDLTTKTSRQFLEDVICELSQRLADTPQDERRGPHARFIYQPLPALKDLRRTLGCDDYHTGFRPVNLDIDEHPHYAGLGAVGDFDEQLIVFAYERQRECDPPNRPYYLECLQGIANGRNSADLQEEVAKAVSLGEFTLKDVEDAYKFLDIDPKTGDDYVIGQYMSRIESAPRQKEEARQCLLTIGRARNSSKIQAHANNKEMTAEEAFEYLGVTSDTSSDSIEAAAVARSLDGDTAKVARALRVIATLRNNEYALHSAASAVESGNSDSSSLNVADAYRHLQITDPNTPEESVFAYYQTLSSNAPPGSKDIYNDALRVIAQTRNSKFLWAKLSDPNAVVQAERGSSDTPVGLDNIGNTCYLNSLLQYYYTVRPVRNVVMNFQEYRMPLNTENMLKKRVGGRAVSKGEIVKAQRFVEELQELFKNLKSASTQSVKPSQDLAELTLFSSATEANFRRASISSPSGAIDLTSGMDGPVFGPSLPPPPPPPQAPPPPVPNRPAPAPAVEDYDIEMIDRPQEGFEHDDTSSDATLVDLDQAAAGEDPAGDIVKLAHGSSDVFESPTTNIAATALPDAPVKTQNTIVETAEVESDEVMANGGILTPPSDSDIPVPERPPPVPPRNKPAPIKTSGDTEDQLRAQKLSFGAQQDVTEVIGNVMFRLQCAIKPTSIDPKFGEQIDNIRETFYGANAVYLKKGNSYDVKVEDWANIIVFPASDGSRDIYEALDVVFDEQIVEIDKAETTQHASINKLPPVVQIQIQRTAFDPVTQQASKNPNKIVFEETIYLDRYMDSEKIMKRRRDAWKWKCRMRQLETRQKILQNTKSQLPVPEALEGSRDFLRMLEEDDYEDVPINAGLSEILEERAAEISHELKNIDEEITVLEKKLKDQFTDMREHRYRLQAVFIHRGTNAFGHYWIYIYDFPRDIWREYNDERVTVVDDRNKIFDQGAVSHAATPYYLVYVRDEDKDDLVDAVCREIVEEPEPVATNAQLSADWQDEAIDLTDGTEHVERVKPAQEQNFMFNGAWDPLPTNDDRTSW